MVIIYTSISEVWAGLYFSIKYRKPAWLHNKIRGQEKEQEADADRRLTWYFHTMLGRFAEEFQTGEAQEVLLLAALCWSPLFLLEHPFLTVEWEIVHCPIKESENQTYIRS